MTATAPSTALDPVTVQVIRNSFVAAADEMKITMIKTAYNDLLIEVQDFGCVITDEQGRLLAQSETLPVFLSVLPGAIRVGLDRFGADGFAEGDVVLANDPYTTGTHISDTAIYMPIFSDDDQLLGFTGCMAHWADIGGKSPGGWCPDSTDIFQEGLRFDHIKVAEAGAFNRALLDLIWSNLRLPLIVRGDFGAQLAACKTGARRVREIHGRFGTQTIRDAVEVIFDQSERAFRASISELPDGEYEAEGFLDHDGVDRSEEIAIRVRVRVAGDSVVADFTGSSTARRGPVNCPLPAVRAGVESAIKALTIPFDRTNAGHSRPLEVRAPVGTVVNPSFPSPVDSYGYVYQLVAELVIRALADAVPERASAGGYPLFLIYFFRVADHAREARSLSEGSFVFVDPAVGGSGALSHRDGASALICLLDGDAPCPVAEMIESRYPLRLERYALNPESCGAGTYRGGMGTIKDYIVLEDGLFSQISVEGTRHPAWGLHGGADAQPSHVVLWPGTDREQVVMDKIGDVGPFQAGDLVSVRTGGGGGWGDPLRRDPRAVADDVRNELLTVDEARAQYGVSIDVATGDVHQADTEAVRAQALGLEGES